MPGFVNRDIKLETPLFTARIFWARSVSSEKDTWMTDKTRHSFWEIQMALEGEIEMRLADDEVLSISQNEFALIPPNEYHAVTRDESHCRRFIMAFSLIGKTAAAKDAVRAMEIPAPRPVTIGMERFLPALLQPPVLEDAFAARERTLAFEAFLLELLQCFAADACNGAESKSQQEIDDLRVKRVLRHIGDRHGIGVGVEELAERFNISPRHLNRLIVAATGKNVREAINREKLKMMEDLLSSTDLSLSEISGICEFADAYGMNKFFKRYNLISPAKYRRLTRGKEKA